MELIPITEKLPGISLDLCIIASFVVVTGVSISMTGG